MRGIGDLLIAPVQPWDAIICTSIDAVLSAIAQAGSLTVEDILRRCGGAEPATQIYLARRLVYLLKFDVLRRVPQEP